MKYWYTSKNHSMLHILITWFVVGATLIINTVADDVTTADPTAATTEDSSTALTTSIPEPDVTIPNNANDMFSMMKTTLINSEVAMKNMVEKPLDILNAAIGIDKKDFETTTVKELSPIIKTFLSWGKK